MNVSNCTTWPRQIGRRSCRGTQVGQDAAHRARYFEGRFPLSKPALSLWWTKEANSVVGFAAVEVGTDEVDEVYGFARDFYVEPERRRQGYGRRFAQMLLDWMRGQGANRVYLHVRSTARLHLPSGVRLDLKRSYIGCGKPWSSPLEAGAGKSPMLADPRRGCRDAGEVFISITVSDEDEPMNLAAAAPSLLKSHASVRSVQLVGSRAEGRATKASDWDFLVETEDFQAVARDLPRLVGALRPLGQQWDRLSERECYMLMLPGPVKVDLLFAVPHTQQGPWEITSGTLPGVDAHFWDWTLWLTSKQGRAPEELIGTELAKMWEHILRPLGVEQPPRTITEATISYLVARDRWEQCLRLSVPRDLEQEVLPCLSRWRNVLANPLVTLEPADDHNVGTLIQWTLDPVAQGPHKRVPVTSADELRTLFLSDPGRQYFMLRRTADGKPLGRFYYRAWRFSGKNDAIDWELNIMLADPNERGKGYGSAAQRLVAEHLLERHDTRSVFAVTSAANLAERRALLKAGFEEAGRLPHSYYRLEPVPKASVLYVRTPAARRS